MKQLAVRVATAAMAVGVLASGALAETIVTGTLSAPFPATRTGTLGNQNTALELSFTLPSMSNVTIFTTSYATGGFQPNLTLFNALGNYVTTGVTAGSSPVAQKDPITNFAFDAYLTASGLSAGMYTMALTDFLLNQALTATNLSDGFKVNYGPGTTFVDEMGNARTASYAITLNAVSATAVPEPGTVWLAGTCLAALAMYAKKKRS